MIAETAFAKLNLALHVRARRADGYHSIETIFAFVDDGDRLSAETADTLSLEVTGPFAGALAGEGDNLVLRAARALRDAAGIAAGARITLDKRLPVASGIGGGSADAAAALRLLDRLWGLGWGIERLIAIGRPLGADIAACVASQACRGDELGDVLHPIDGAALAGMPVLLVNPGVAVATGPVFAGWDQRDRGALPPGDPRDIALAGRNDLAEPAEKLAPAIGDVMAALRHDGPVLARMSGSGATCFALYRDPGRRDAAASRIAAERPDWWLMPGALR